MIKTHSGLLKSLNVVTALWKLTFTDEKLCSASKYIKINSNPTKRSMAKPFRGKYHISLLLSLVENVFFVRFELYFRLVPRHTADSRMSISEEKACVRLCTAKITCTEKPHHPKKAFDEPTSESCVPKCYLFRFSPKLTMRHLSHLSRKFTRTAIERWIWLPLKGSYYAFSLF